MIDDDDDVERVRENCRHELPHCKGEIVAKISRSRVTHGLGRSFKECETIGALLGLVPMHRQLEWRKRRTALRVRGGSKERQDAPQRQTTPR